MNSKTAILIIGIICVLFISSCDDNKQKNEKFLKWYSSNTGFQVPQFYNSVQLFEGNEWGKIIELECDSNYLEEVITKYPFVKVNLKDSKIHMMMDINRELFDRSSGIKKKYYEYSDYNEDYLWVVLIDKEAKIIWMEIIYADASGDKYW